MINTNRSKVYVKLVLLAASLLAAVLTSECALATFSPQPDYVIRPHPYLADPTLGHRFRRNADLSQNGKVFHTDSNGFRVLDAKRAPSAADRVVLFIGDSQSFGWGVVTEDTFISHVERLLNDRHSDPIRAVNAAEPGWNLWNYRAAFDEGLRLYPNTVATVLWITANDWEPADRYRVEDGYLEDQQDGGHVLPESARVFLSKLNTWRLIQRVWRTAGSQSDGHSAAASGQPGWSSATQPLDELMLHAERARVPVVLLLDSVVEAEPALAGQMTAAPVAAVIKMDAIEGGTLLFDGHIDVNKHRNLGEKLAAVLNGILNLQEQQSQAPR